MLPAIRVRHVTSGAFGRYRTDVSWDNLVGARACDRTVHVSKAHNSSNRKKVQGLTCIGMPSILYEAETTVCA